MIKSKIYAARKNTPSIKTTVPLPIAEALKLGRGDIVSWHIDYKEGKPIAIVEKVED